MANLEAVIAAVCRLDFPPIKYYYPDEALYFATFFKRA